MPKQLRIRKEFLHPGEYGKEKAEGFAIITHPSLNGQKIFISSHKFTDGVMHAHKIPETHHVNLLRTNKFKNSVPEIKLGAHEGLKIFRDRLSKLGGVNPSENIIINCRRGRNRSPVAALIYMVDRGIPYDDAYQAVMAGMQQRFPNFVFNPYSNYDHVLKCVEKERCLRVAANLHQASLTLKAG